MPGQRGQAVSAMPLAAPALPGQPRQPALAGAKPGAPGVERGQVRIGQVDQAHVELDRRLRRVEFNRWRSFNRVVSRRWAPCGAIMDEPIAKPNRECFSTLQNSPTWMANSSVPPGLTRGPTRPAC